MNTLKSKTPKELLENTVKRYNVNTRAVKNIKAEESRCFYYKENTNKRCAIGIEVYKNIAKELQKSNAPINYEEQFDLLPKRLRKMGIEFLQNVQRLHDHKKYWDEKGLSKLGEDFVKEIKQDYNIK